MQVHDAPLFDSLASKSIRKISEFQVQNRTNIAWSFSGMMFHIESEPLVKAISAKAIARIRELGAQDLGNTAWACAKLDVDDCMPLLHAISASALPKLRHLSASAQEQSNISWALATLVIAVLPLFDSISSASIKRIRAFSAPEIANPSWSFSA